MIPIYKPYMPQNIGVEISEILYSGQLGFGKYGREFENKLQSFIGAEYVLSVSSYNIAMLIVLSTLGLREGDEVIASPVSCLASNQPFAVKGLRVVWVDVNPATGAMCPDDLKSKITKNTKAIFHNHFCGYLGDIESINAICNSFGIPVVDDGIEAFGSQYKGRKLGNLGTDVTVFSFQTVRLPNTIDGGAIVFKDKDLYEKALLIRDYGIDRTIFRSSNGEINPDCDIEVEGYAGLMSELNSYIGTRQMDDINSLLAVQKNNAAIWNDKFTNLDTINSLKITAGCIPNYWVYGTLCKNKTKTIKDFKEQGYYATGVHINNNIYSVFNNNVSLKGVNEFINHFVAVPCGWWFENK
ncbi:DegT/DnrJ/EryC1/StrS family aminotransferase [Flavobacterium granuli]|uniref:dTDP-4-amino-4,6-dideoxygalactose transaminase n=1 Tax=Flavobacterium granuli TaxID=280093 RepID=A0A1M5SJI6_9FLAO|nr:aminotransferase class V-fold PLP-dependent enzyme [Flavobacterium granuli]PRZ21010.1 dTDP-4-amino-4,6-dideoxygalactose transaminase [Flavobacterium granuli]SHH38649.1 dTDP-4-amino-4,6-dideoxygalactose transaminase [Flavobacterium granuli]